MYVCRRVFLKVLGEYYGVTLMVIPQFLSLARIVVGACFVLANHSSTNPVKICYAS